MRNATIIFLCLVLLSACNSKSQFEAPINDYIQHKTGADNVNYKPSSFDLIDSVDCITSVEKFWSAIPENNGQSREQRLVEIKTGLVKWEKMESMKEAYLVWNWEIKRYQQYSNNEPHSIDYYVVKHTYSHNNVLTNKPVTESLFFILNGKTNKIMAVIDESRWPKYFDTANDDKLKAYRSMIFEDRNTFTQ